MSTPKVWRKRLRSFSPRPVARPRVVDAHWALLAIGWIRGLWSQMWRKSLHDQSVTYSGKCNKTKWECEDHSHRDRVEREVSLVMFASSKPNPIHQTTRTATASPTYLSSSWSMLFYSLGRNTTIVRCVSTERMKRVKDDSINEKVKRKRAKCRPIFKIRQFEMTDSGNGIEI